MRSGSSLLHARLSRSWWLLQSLLLNLLLSLLLSACSREAVEQTAPPPSVSVVEVGTQEVGDYVEYVARTEAFKVVELRARVEGTITQRLFKEGDTVEQGQLLFEIDRDNYLAAFEEAEANLASAQAEQRRTEADYKRGLELRPNGFISQSDLDTLASNAAKARAAEKGARAALRNARVNLGYTRITAPFTGRISTVNYNVGNLVGPSSGSLATLLQDDPIYANFQVAEDTYISRIQQFAQQTEQGRFIDTPPEDALTITLVLPNGTLHDHTGTINYAGIQVNATTGTVNLRAQFANPTGIVRPGLYCTLILESTDKTRQPVVPQYAVQEGQQGKFVLIVNADNQVQTRNIQVGRSIGSLWVVNSGLASGDRLIVEGLQKVHNGTTVNPVVKYLNSQTGTLHDTPAEAAPGGTSDSPTDGNL